MFFVILMILGNIMLFSLFTAILLQNFEGDEEEEDKDLEVNVDGKPKVKVSSKWENMMKEFMKAFGKRKRKDSRK